MNNLNLHLEEGRHWALVGADGAAKSRLCEYLAGRAPKPGEIQVVYAGDLDESVQIVSFAQQSAAAQKNGFMQARYYSMASEFGPRDAVEDVLSFDSIFDVNPFEVGRPLTKEREAYKHNLKRTVRLFNLAELLDREFIALSNGETRRVLLARAVLANPKILVLDNPCAGLDPGRREQLKKICDAVAARGVMLVMSVRHEDEIPNCVTNVAEIAGGKIISIRAHEAQGETAELETPKIKRNPQCGVHDSGGGKREVIALRNLKIAFGQRKLFDDFTWVVRKGEHWVLRGANGSGKTTLLSLITGDNPLAYANDVTVFGYKRGGGGVELAKIRERIGMVSPEMQAYTGESAMALLENALKRKPDLLLLDEPCLNLDEADSLKLRKRVAGWLEKHPECTSVCVVHRPQDLPDGFNLELSLI